ncbi:Hypp5362 [Branchiostoma lanceolatum]|uniref:Hypp5362 protein n=1 Tax=Branchiostoma lanceolatum TaxID=7740 RepID=A0A8K0AFV1_BRALA|nr:Hypp5362 [Branchiostoma lanceolatum]
MTPEMFRELLQRVTPHIDKDHRHGMPIQPGMKLAMTLRYMASEDSYRFMACNFRVPHNTISLFIPEVCQAIIAEYQHEVFKFPQTADEWREVAEEFGRRWNFHHACGVIDGKQ